MKLMRLMFDVSFQNVTHPFWQRLKSCKINRLLTFFITMLTTINITDIDKPSNSFSTEKSTSPKTNSSIIKPVTESGNSKVAILLFCSIVKSVCKNYRKIPFFSVSRRQYSYWPFYRFVQNYFKLAKKVFYYFVMIKLNRSKNPLLFSLAWRNNKI